MTSSRLPIGVAQTASGIRLRRRPAASKAASAAPSMPADVPSSACTMRTESRIGFSASRAITSRAGAKQQLAGRSEPAADHDQLGVERVDQAADRRAQLASDLGEELDRRRIALAREPNELMRVRVGPERLAGDRVRRGPGDVRLEVSAASAAAREAVVDEDDVTELDAGTDRSAVGATAEDQTAADAGAEREHHHVARAATGTRHPLGDRGRIRVVLDRDGQAEPLAHQIPERNVDQRDVRRGDRHSDPLVDSGWNTEADRRHAVVEKLREPLPRARPAGTPRTTRGVGYSQLRETVPSRLTTPARIFVPPTSTPITFAFTGGGYLNRRFRPGYATTRCPTGYQVHPTSADLGATITRRMPLGREAVSGLPGRPRQRKVPSAQSQARTEPREPPADGASGSPPTAGGFGGSRS